MGRWFEINCFFLSMLSQRSLHDRNHTIYAFLICVIFLLSSYNRLSRLEAVGTLEYKGPLWLKSSNNLLHNFIHSVNLMFRREYNSDRLLFSNGIGNQGLQSTGVSELIGEEGAS